jgi:hypothetical protein
MINYEKLAKDLLDNMVKTTSAINTIQFLLMSGLDVPEIIKLGFNEETVNIIYLQLK